MLVLLCIAASAMAQDKKHESELRAVRGVVADKADQPVLKRMLPY